MKEGHEMTAHSTTRSCVESSPRQNICQHVVVCSVSCCRLYFYCGPRTLSSSCLWSLILGGDNVFVGDFPGGL